MTVITKSLTFLKVEVPTPLFSWSLSVFIVFTIPRQKVNKDRRHFAVVRGTKIIYVRKVIDGAMNYVYANGSEPLSLSRIGGVSKTPCIAQIKISVCTYPSG